MAEIESHQDLKVWQKAMDLVVQCYRLAAEFPKSEVYGLTSQLQRAAVSIPANIAEGRGRRSTKDFLRFLDIAYGSLMELETHLQIADRLQYSSPDRINPLLQLSAEIGRMLNGLQVSLERRLESQ